MEPDLRCYHHPEREAVNQCDCCGDYLCSECVQEFRGEYVCSKCLKWRIAEVRKREGRKESAIYALITLLSWLLGLVVSGAVIGSLLLITARWLREVFG